MICLKFHNSIKEHLDVQKEEKKKEKKKEKTSANGD
jgi:hypothetical protein